MRITIVVIAMSLSQPVLAEAVFSETDLRSLMTTQAYRDRVDSVRQGNVASGGKQTRIRPSEVVVNGVIKRSDGKDTVWINGHDMRHSTIDGIKVSRKQPRDDAVSVYVDGKLVRVKPGERWSAGER